MATTTTKTTKKKKLVYKQDPDGVFRLKKINDDVASLKTNEAIDKKTQVDQYLNELIDCSYSIVDEDEESGTTQTTTAEENFMKITTPTTAATTTDGGTMRRKKIKPTTNNTSSKNLKIKSASPIPVSAPPFQPQVAVTSKPDPSPQAAAPPPLPSPIPVPSSTEFVVKTKTEESKIEAKEEIQPYTEEEVEEMVPDKSTFMSRLIAQVPGFLAGIISTCVCLKYRQELAYGLVGLTVIGIALGVVTILGICSCLYLGLINLDDLKRYLPFSGKPKVAKDTDPIREEYNVPLISEPEEKDDHEVLEEKDSLPQYTHEEYGYEDDKEEPGNIIEQYEYQPEQLYEDKPVKQVNNLHPHKHQDLPPPEEYKPLEGPKPPKLSRPPKEATSRRASSTVKIRPYRYENREHKVFNVVPINTSIPLPNNEYRHHMKTKPELVRASTEPSRLNSKKKKSGSSSPISTKSDYSNHIHHYHPKAHSQPAQVGVPPQLLKVKQLPKLPSQAEELPFINEIKLVDGYSDEEDADQVDIPSEAPIYHYKTEYADNLEFLKRNQSTMSKHSVLGTRSNYNKFISNVRDDYEH